MKKISCIMILMVLMFTNMNVFSSGIENIALNAFIDIDVYNNVGNKVLFNSYDYKNIVDGNEFSVFKTPLGTQRAVFVMDLYKAQPYNRMMIKESYSSILEFEVFTSSDKRNWNKVYKGTKVGAYGKYISFPKTNHRYVRLDIKKTSNKFNDAIVAISEWQLYNDNKTLTVGIENSIYLAQMKQTLLKSEALKGKFSDDTIDKFNKQIEIARNVLNSNNASQDVLDKEIDKLDEMTLFFETNLEYSDSDYEVVRKKLSNMYTGNLIEKDENRLNTIKNQGEVAKKWKDSIIKTDKTTELWDDLIPPKANFAQESGKLGDAFTRIRAMALAYKQEGNNFYNDKQMLDDIVYCLEFMLSKKYNVGIEIYSNWYPWRVSAPSPISETMIMLRDELSEDLMGRLQKAVEYYVPVDFHYTFVGANRLYLSASSLKMGVALHDEFYIHRPVYALQQEGLYVDKQSKNESNNGFFWDGSYVFHDGFMYNATYGRDQLSNTSNIINALTGTLWQIEQATIDDIAKRLIDGFEAIIYKGATVDVAAGRGLGNGLSYGKTLANTIQAISEYFPEPNQSKFLGIAKQFKIDLGIKDALVMNDDIKARGDIYRLKRFPIGDKLVGQFGDWGLGLSMFSNRTKTFEATNGDAMKAWYASSGMTYVLNNDKTQYDRDYWIAVDHYRLPGITVDLIPRTTNRYEGEIYNPNNWVSSIDYDEKYGVAGMQAYNWNSSMSANKSWFIFDNSVVSLGSSIRGGTNEIQTIVDNRKLKDDNSNVILINGEEFTNNVEATISNVKYAHISGNVEKSDVGYYFPNLVELVAVKETRTQKESEMWFSDSKQEVTKNFAKLWLNHGKQPNNENYSYVILPNMSEKEVEEYSKAPEIEIISQDNIAHIVKNKRLNVTGYNFWKKTGGSSGGVTVNGQLIMMVNETESQIDISMTDPTFTASRPKIVTFENCNVDKIVNSSPNVKVLSTRPLKISVDLTGINGKKVTFSALKSGGGNK